MPGYDDGIGGMSSRGLHTTKDAIPRLRTHCGKAVAALSATWLTSGRILTAVACAHSSRQ
jgi:hypothetical protein